MKKIFPELNLTKFKEISKQWVDDYKAEDVSITEIKLCKHRVPKYIKRANKGKRNIKYAVVFSIPEHHGQYSLSANDTPEQVLKKIKQNESDPYENFISDTGYYETVFTERTHSPLFDENFQQIYKQRPPSEFEKEWLFIPKYQGFILSESIRIDEGFVVLYDQSIKDGNEQFKVNNLRTHNQNNNKKSPEEKLNRLFIELEPEVEILYQNIKDELKSKGRKMFDATVGIALSIFESKEFNHIKGEDIKKSAEGFQTDRPCRDIKGRILVNAIKRKMPNEFINKEIPTNHQKMYHRYLSFKKEPKK